MKTENLKTWVILFVALALQGCATGIGSHYSSQPVDHAERVLKTKSQQRIEVSHQVALTALQTDHSLDWIRTADAKSTQKSPPRRVPLFSPTPPVPRVVPEFPSLIDQVFTDHLNYYSSNNLGVLATGFSVGAVVANSSMDGDVYEHFNKSIRDATSDDWSETFHAPKELGNGMYTLPVFAAAWGAGLLFEDSFAGQVTGEWGERSLRAFLVGAPPVMLMQAVTGGGRPEEGSSAWDFLDDNNSVSGHAFMGALPFLTAGQMTEDPFAKIALYAASTIVPFSRVSDGDHYASQALLGWWMAWSATMAVDATQSGDENWRTLPLLGPGYSGMAIEFRW